MWLAEAELYHYKARAYNPALGRFMQTDPIGYGDGMNLYAYVGGDPINFRDYSGSSKIANDVCDASCKEDALNPWLWSRLNDSSGNTTERDITSLDAYEDKILNAAIDKDALDAFQKISNRFDVESKPEPDENRSDERSLDDILRKRGLLASNKIDNFGRISALHAEPASPDIFDKKRFRPIRVEFNQRRCAAGVGLGIVGGALLGSRGGLVGAGVGAAGGAAVNVGKCVFDYFDRPIDEGELAIRIDAINRYSGGKAFPHVNQPRKSLD